MFELSKSYKGAAGFYSSGSLLHWVKALIYFRSSKIKLLTSPLLSNHDQNLIKDINDEKEIIRFQNQKLEDLIEGASNDLNYPNISNILNG